LPNWGGVFYMFVSAAVSVLWTGVTSMDVRSTVREL
jgi:hypothetical protein